MRAIIRCREEVPYKSHDECPIAPMQMQGVRTDSISRPWVFIKRELNHFLTRRTEFLEEVFAVREGFDIDTEVGAGYPTCEGRVQGWEYD